MEPPVKPDESDCCNSGCNPCILDFYEEQLKKYEKYLKNQLQDSKVEPNNNCIYPTCYSVFNVVKITKQTTNLYIFKFQFSRFQKESISADGKHLFYNPGQHFLLKASSRDSETEFTRAYTPIPLYDEEIEPNTFTALIRLYETGKMSSYLKSLKCGDETLWRGPYCDFTIDYSFKHSLLIAQGTGIAPIFAIINDILSNDNCETIMRLFFCCKDIKDIPIRDELYKLQSYWNFKYEVFLSNSSDIFTKYNEIIREYKLGMSDIKQFLNDKPISKTQVLICGSDNFGKCIKGYVDACGVADENIYVFV